MLKRAAAGRAGPEVCAVVIGPGHPGAGAGLVPPLTRAEAADLGAAFLHDAAGNALAAGPGTAVFLALGPAGPPDAALPEEVGLLQVDQSPDHDSSHRRRLAAADDLFALGYGSACLLDPGSPTLPTAWLAGAARALARPGERLVLGPTAEGGLYLVGLRPAHRPLLDDASLLVDADALRRRADAQGIEVELLPPWYAVHDAGALRRAIEETRRPGVPQPDGAVPYGAPRTAGCLKAMLAGSDLGNRLGIGGGVEADMSEGSLS